MLKTSRKKFGTGRAVRSIWRLEVSACSSNFNARFPFVCLSMNLGNIMIDHGLEATFTKQKHRIIHIMPKRNTYTHIL